MQHPDLRQQGKWLKAIFNQEQIVKGGQLVVTAGLVVVLLIAVGCVSDAAGQVGQQFGIDIPLGGGGDSSGGADLEQCFIMIENWSETTLGAVNQHQAVVKQNVDLKDALDETVLERDDWWRKALDRQTEIDRLNNENEGLRSQIEAMRARAQSILEGS